MELYSLHYFMKLAAAGETAALDMLHVNKENLLISSQTWEKLVQYRTLFYTKNLKAFTQYARKQAAKYGIKGSRLNNVQTILSILKSHDPKARLRDIPWQNWLQMEHIKPWEHIPSSESMDTYVGAKGVEICGKKFTERLLPGGFGLGWISETVRARLAIFLELKPSLRCQLLIGNAQ
jgi:hypothetical protein